jgi:hypothetical protein
MKTIMNDSDEMRISAISVFSNIARENFQNILGFESKQQEISEKSALSGGNDLEEVFIMSELEREVFKSVSIVIVFSAIAVESYIYDYAARNLSDAYVKKYLDKLDPISKWIIIPRLLTGKEMPRDHRWFELLNKLFQQRNRIVHQKSSSPPAKIEDMVSFYQSLKQNSDQTNNSAKEAIELLDILPNEIRGIDPCEYVWISINLAPNPDNLFIP